MQIINNKNGSTKHLTKQMRKPKTGIRLIVCSRRCMTTTNKNKMFKTYEKKRNEKKLFNKKEFWRKPNCQKQLHPISKTHAMNTNVINRLFINNNKKNYNYNDKWHSKKKKETTIIISYYSDTPIHSHSHSHSRRICSSFLIWIKFHF